MACVKSVGRRKTDAGRMHIGKRHHKQPEAAKTVAPEITGGVGQPAVGIGFVNRQRRDDKAVFDCHAVVQGIRRKTSGRNAGSFFGSLCWVKGRLKAGSDGLFCICVESNTVIQNQIFISYANNPGIPFPVVQFESLGSKTMVPVVPNPPVHVC